MMKAYKTEHKIVGTDEHGGECHLMTYWLDDAEMVKDYLTNISFPNIGVGGIGCLILSGGLDIPLDEIENDLYKADE